MILKKQDIESLPLKELNGYTTVELEQWIQKEKLQNYHQWLLPQLVAHFGTWRIHRDGEGRPLVLKTLKENLQDDPKLQAIWKLSRVTRSLLLPSQTQHPQYAQFTPLILMGFKLYKDVNYSQWQGLEGLEWILEPKLYEALNLSDEQLVCCSLGSERLLEIRQEGLLNKFGAKVGTLKPAESTWALTGIKHTELGNLPKLTQSMLTQIWIAHPSKRTQYMILDPTNWDRMPEPLVSSEVFQQQKQEPKQTKDHLTLPWL